MSEYEKTKLIIKLTECESYYAKRTKTIADLKEKEEELINYVEEMLNVYKNRNQTQE